MTSVEHARDDWDTHWEHYSEESKDNPAVRMRVNLVLASLALGKAPARVIDIGSGQGDFVAALVDRHPHVEALGIELSHAGVDIATIKVPSARFVQRDLMTAELPPPTLLRWATHATCSEVLEHVDDPVILLRNAAAYMADGCRLIVTVPGGPMSAFDHHLGHRGHFTRARLRSVLEAAGFGVEYVSGAGFPFFNLYRLMVVARGRKVIEDATATTAAGTSKPVMAVMRLFSFLFRFNLPPSRLGWQVVAVARLER